MKGESLTTSVFTEELSSHVAKCVDVLGSLKENSHLIHRLNTFDASVQGAECNFMHTSFCRTAITGNDSVRMELYSKLKEKPEHSILSPINDYENNSQVGSDQMNVNSSDNNKCLYPTAPENSHSHIEQHAKIEEPKEQASLFKVPNSFGCVGSTVNLNFSQSKIERLRGSLKSLLKTPIREILKTKFHSQTNRPSGEETCLNEGIAKFPTSHQKISKRTKRTPRRVRFIAENCFKVCDKNEIKELLSPLMKTSLSEILRSKVTTQTTDNSSDLDMQKSETSSSGNACYKSCSKYSFTESDYSNNVLFRDDETSLGTSKNDVANVSFRSESDYQGDYEQQKDVSSDESSWGLTSSSNSLQAKNLFNLSNGNERWKTAVSPLLKTSISDILRRKLNGSNIRASSSVTHGVVPKKHAHSVASNVKKHKVILSERITRSNKQFMQTRSKKDKNSKKSSASSVKSYTITSKSKSKAKAKKVKGKSHEKNNSESAMANLALQTYGDTKARTEKMSLISIMKKKKRKKYFRGGRYNFFSGFPRRKSKQLKSVQDDESASGVQSEGGSLLTDGWPSDVSFYDSFSSFSSEYPANSEDINTRFKNSRMSLIENENVFKESSALHRNAAVDTVISTDSHKIENCSKSSEITDFVKSSKYMTRLRNHAYKNSKAVNTQSTRKCDISDTYNVRTATFYNNKLSLRTKVSHQLHVSNLPVENRKHFISAKTMRCSPKNTNVNSKKIGNSDNDGALETEETSIDSCDNHIGGPQQHDSSIIISQSNHTNRQLSDHSNKENPTGKKKESYHLWNDRTGHLDKGHKGQCVNASLDIEGTDSACIINSASSIMCSNDLEVLYGDNSGNLDNNILRPIAPQAAEDKLRELINEKQNGGDDGVFVTITVNSEGIVEDIEKIDASLFVDVTTQPFVPIEESSELPVADTTDLGIGSMSADAGSCNQDPGVIPLMEETCIPEPCYTLEILGDTVSTVITEQFESSEKLCEIGVQSELMKESSDFVKTNDLQKENFSIAGNVKGRKRAKRKFPEDHLDVDCLSLSSSSSVETEYARQKKRGKSFLSFQESPKVTPSPPELRLETCSVYDYNQKGGSCHKTCYTNTVGLYLVKELYLSEKNLLKRRSGINLENPTLTICHHHKKVYLDKFDEIQKAGNTNSVTICSCYDTPVELQRNEVISENLSICCEAKDSIDDKVIGCSNVVTKYQLVCASEKVPRAILCEVHLWRLRHHQCCPNCGVFCTQGTFSQCATQRKSHYQLHLFHTHCVSSSANGLSSYCPHCGSTSNFRKIKLELNIPISPPSRPKNKVLVRAETKSVTLNDDEIDSTEKKKKEESAKQRSFGVSSEKLCLSKTQQQALLSAMESVNTNVRSAAIKASYGPIKIGDIDRVLQMLASGFNPNHRFEDHNNDTPLHIAAESGHLTLVQILIQAGASVDHTNDDLFTPLMMAIENNHLPLILYLLAAGAHLDTRSDDGTTSLHLAAQDGRNEICNVLLDSGKIDINIQDDGGWTPLVWAAENQHLETVKLLLERGADPNIRDNEENISLHWSAFSGNVDISQLFLDVGCELSAANIRGDTPLHISARQGNYECVILFLARGANTKVKNNNNETPIMCCLDQYSQTWMVLSMNDGENFSSDKNLKAQGKILHRDISRGKEFIPIQCYNGEDNKPAPDDFTYITENCETDYVNIDRTITSLQSCRCNNKCRYPSCSCATLSFKCWYDEESCLLPEFNMSDPPMIFECNPACLCWKDCSSRVVQNGIRCHLQVFRTEEIEWGVRTLHDIPKGTFVCEYVGEYVTELEAEKRTDDSYLFELDNREDARYCLDAKYFGNVGRFINHLCDANLCPVKVFIEHQDLNFPRIAFFTTRHVKSYEELGFDYGPKYWSAKYKQGIYCLCNSPKCRYNKDSILSTLNEYSHSSEEEQSKDDTL